MTGQTSIFDYGVDKPSAWKTDIDNDMQMLRCESCGSRVIRLWYDLAVGDHGFRYCPYCGKEMSNWRDLIVPWPGFKEDFVSSWRKADKPPKGGEYVLLSFENYGLPMIGCYLQEEDGGAYYAGDDDIPLISHGLVVNAWMRLPQCYREEDS